VRDTIILRTRTFYVAHVDSSIPSNLQTRGNSNTNNHNTTNTLPLITTHSKITTEEEGSSSRHCCWWEWSSSFFTTSIGNVLRWAHIPALGQGLEQDSGDQEDQEGAVATPLVAGVMEVLPLEVAHMAVAHMVVADPVHLPLPLHPLGDLDFGQVLPLVDL